MLFFVMLQQEPDMLLLQLPLQLHISRMRRQDDLRKAVRRGVETSGFLELR
jgi:hypothetical protein